MPRSKDAARISENYAALADGRDLTSAELAEMARLACAGSGALCLAASSLSCFVFGVPPLPDLCPTHGAWAQQCA